MRVLQRVRVEVHNFTISSNDLEVRSLRYIGIQVACTNGQR